MHVYHGKHPFTRYPITQGHEVSGEIVELGEGVDTLQIGQAVTIQPQVVCQKCHPCRHGKYNLCESLKVMGFQTTGAASRFLAVDASKVTPLPDGMSYIEGAMIEPLSVGVHAVRQVREIAGKTVIVLGAGPIGNLLAQAAKGMGASKVMITDVSDFRLKKAAECGIHICINTKNTELGEAIQTHFGPDKADFIFDCAGNNNTIGQAVRHARKGSTIIVVAVFENIASVDFALANDHELCLNTSFMYRSEDYLRAVDLIQEKKVKLAPLVTKHFPFGEYKQAYEFIDANRESVMKVFIDVQR